MHTAEQVKAHADVMELAGVDFIREDGSYWRGGKTKGLHRVRLTFIDGAVFTVSRAEYDGKLLDYAFRLRPSRPDA